MTSKEKILKNIKDNNIVKSVKLPSYENFGIKYENKFEIFSTMLESVGGKALVIQKDELDKIQSPYTIERKNKIYVKARLILEYSVNVPIKYNGI